MDLSFFDCNLSYTSFTELKLADQVFMSCKLEEADFGDCDLSKSKFDECNLERAVFGRTNLQKADLSTATNFSIDPDNNSMSGAIFSKDNLEGLLQKHKLKILK